jgi:hypothetical protein
MEHNGDGILTNNAHWRFYVNKIGYPVLSFFGALLSCFMIQYIHYKKIYCVKSVAMTKRLPLVIRGYKQAHNGLCSEQE